MKFEVGDIVEWSFSDDMRHAGVITAVHEERSVVEVNDEIRILAHRISLVQPARLRAALECSEKANEVLRQGLIHIREGLYDYSAKGGMGFGCAGVEFLAPVSTTQHLRRHIERSLEEAERAREALKGER